MARRSKYRSVNITRFFMKIVGLWQTETGREKRGLNALFAYTVVALSVAMLIETVDLYHCLWDIHAVTYNLGVTILLVVILSKVCIFYVNLDTITQLISHAEKNFWNTDYDEVDSKILQEFEKKGAIMTYTVTFTVYFTVGIYVTAPLFENHGRNQTERVLPFKLWINLPVYVTPYYEIAYFVEFLSAYHTAVCAFSFDNFMCTMTVHTAAQLKILQRRIEVIVDKYVKCISGPKSLSKMEGAKVAYTELTFCVRRHISLTHFIEQMESAFTYIFLGHLVLASLVMCCSGYQLLTTDTLRKRFMFTWHIISVITNIFVGTWTCNDIIILSSGLSEAAYNTKWYLLPKDGYGKTVKEGLIMIMMRTKRQCALTAGGFGQMSVNIFTNVLGTSMSYFTLLRQISEKED